MMQNREVIRQVGHIYKWIDEQLIANKSLAGICETCGKCCDFESFGHRLFVTTPEMLYFADKVGSRNPDLSGKQMANARCCYQRDGKCTVYPYRFAGCRIFCCKGNASFQSDLTETAVKKFKAICEDLQIPYRYIDLPTMLKEFYTAETAEKK